MPAPFHFILNGSEPDGKKTARFIQSLTAPGNLRSAGGYIFKTCLTGNALHISIVPAISEGERLHHYDIDVPDTEYLIGSVSARGEFTLLFRTEKSDMNNEIREAWRSRFTAFAVVLFDLGYNGRGELDWITRQIIEESGLFSPIPETLAEIRDKYEINSEKQISGRERIMD